MALELVPHVPVAEEPFVEPVDESPVVDEPDGYEPSAEEPIADEPVADETPAVAEPIAAASEGRSRTRSFRRRGRGDKAKTIVGLKIGTSQLAAAVMSENDGRHELVQVARRPIESGLVVDERFATSMRSRSS